MRSLLLRSCVLCAAVLALTLGNHAAAGDTRHSPRVTPLDGDPVAKKAASAKKEAGKVYVERCVRCHGSEGKGNGPEAAKLDPKPTSFADAKWQKSVSDEQIALIIEKGGFFVGKSFLMPGNRDLDKPVVSELVKVVRSFNPRKGSDKPR